MPETITIFGIEWNTLGLLIGAIATTTVGYFLGKRKNRPVEGTLWGFFLGLIGVVILAFRSKKEIPAVVRVEESELH
jgi:CDP-diglyceride synthetase